MINIDTPLAPRDSWANWSKAYSPYKTSDSLRTQHRLGTYTVWFRPPASSPAYGEGRVAVIVQAVDIASAVKVAMASGLYAMVDTEDNKAFVYDQICCGTPPSE